MENNKLPPLMQLNNGILIPTEELIIAIHERIIKYRREIGKEDPSAIRNRGIISYVCDMLKDRPHKYKKDALENALYVATEVFYYIACQHPFVEGNKSTAYVTALFILYSNIGNNQQLISNNKEIRFVFQHNKEDLLAAPKEAEEITRLAEAGKDESELKKLIKEFLYKSIKV